jgi:Xaa-Pro dipeptidase
MRYFAGVSVLAIERFAGVVIPVDSEPAIVIPELEEEKVRSLSPFKNVLKYSDSEGPENLLRSVLEDLHLTRGTLGIEDFLPYKFYQMITRVAPEARVEEASKILMDLRIIKTPDEIELMRKSASVVARGIEAGVAAIRVGATELEVGFEVERRIRELGGESVPFCLVLTGKNSANPHGSSSKAQIRNGDSVVLDVGAICDGYFADLTRTVFVGTVSAKQRKIYETVLRAQENTIEAVRPGIPASQIDKTARGIIETAGYGDRFIHRTGHGLGLEVHEEPSITDNCETVLRPGMTFTVEPGIYLPQEFGVRIEDNIAVSDDGHITIGACRKELLAVQ